MKKITLWLLFLFASWQTFGQVSAYTFSQSNGTYTPISGGTILGTTTTDDQRFVDPAVPAGGTVLTGVGLPIGFSFIYNGYTYDRFAVNANGWISLGDSSLGANAVNMNTSSSYTSLSSTATTVTNDLVARIAGLNRDLNAQTGAELRFETIGTAPNRTLVVQWTNYRRFNQTGDNLNFQIRLNETSNTVEVVYGTITTAASATYMVGLRANPNNPASNFNSRTTTTDWAASTASTAATNTMTASATIFPASGLTYTWTPPSCAAPGGLTASAITSTSATLSWNAAFPVPSNGYQYFIDTVNTTPAVAGTPEATTTAALGPLTPNTTYYVWVRSDCGGTFSAWGGPISFTTACTTFIAPWTYDVEAAAATTNSSIADCWSSNPTGTTTAYRWDVDAAGGTPTGTSTGPSGAFSGTKYFYTEASSGTTGAVAELISPLVDVSGLTTPTIQFYYHMRGVNIGELHVDVYDGAAWNNDLWVLVGQQQTAGTDPWELAIVSLNTLTITGDVRVRFRGIRGNGISGDIALDDIAFVEAPACFNPINLGAANITSNSVDVLFSDGSGGTQFDFHYIVLPAGSGAPATYPAAGIYEDGSSSVNGIDYSLTVGSLTPNTAYEIYVGADCNGTWVGPVNFTTLCAPFVAPWTYTVETAANTTNSSIADCFSSSPSGTTSAFRWDVTGTGTTPSLGTGASAANSGVKYFYTEATSGTTGAVAELVSPLIDVSGLTTPRLRFFYHMFGAGMGTLNVDVYDGAAWNNDVFTLTGQQQTSLGAPWLAAIVDLSTLTITGNIQIRFRGVRGTTFESDMAIDDITIEETPVTPPPCATNVVATPDASCGNFNNVLTWDAAAGADGYRLTIGTTPGGTDILNDQDLGSVLTYNFAGTISTTYYFTVVPYNANGSATGCSEVSFSTVATGCYCVSNPSSNDGAGITNVDIATTSFPNGDVTYFDHTATTVNLAQGINANVQVTFATGFTYDTNIWIDFNDDFDFDDAGELVYSGASTNANPTTLNASFIMPGAAPLGVHRMRIGTADTGQVPPNPCYNGTWGVTLDFSINVIAATCTPPAVNTSTIVPNCASNQFSVDVDVTALGNGTPALTDGTTTWPISGLGIVTAGPFASGSSVTLTVLHGSDNSCDLPLGSFTYTCPPANDDCANAIPVACNDVVTGDTSAATDSGNNVSADVWYSYSGAAGTITASLCTNTAFDTYIRVFDACGGSEITFNDDSCGLQSSVNFTADGTSTYYIMVEGFGANEGPFELTISCTLSSEDFNNGNFVAYPNPVKDMLTLEYVSEISDVKVINMLGQVVLNKTINATSAQVDMSQLAAGTYLVNVTSGTNQKTIKVVKQ